MDHIWNASSSPGIIKYYTPQAYANEHWFMTAPGAYYAKFHYIVLFPNEPVLPPRLDLGPTPAKRLRYLERDELVSTILMKSEDKDDSDNSSDSDLDPDCYYNTERTLSIPL